MEAKMTDLKKASQCWWFDSHNSAKRSPWLQSTLSELEKKTKCMLNLIGGDADSFAQRAEMYYRKRPELVTMIEDFYRSYRYLAEQHELLRSEAGARRSILFKSDSSNQISYQKTWDSTDTLDYPESEVSEVDNPELEEAGQIESVFAEANEEFEGVRRNLLAKSSVSHVIFNGSAATEPDVQDEINLEVPAKSHKSKRISYSFGEKQMETNQELEHQDEIKLMELPFGMENDQNILKSMNERLEVCPSNTRPILIAPLDFRYSKECEKYCHHECNESISQREIDGYKVDDHETKVLCEMTSEVERLKTENENLMAELEKKDEEKRNVIRQLSLTVEILKEENVNLKRFIKGSKRCSSIFEFKKLKDAFSGTGRLFGLNSQSHPSLVAL